MRKIVKIIKEMIKKKSKPIDIKYNKFNKSSYRNTYGIYGTIYNFLSGSK